MSAPGHRPAADLGARSGEIASSAGSERSAADTGAADRAAADRAAADRTAADRGRSTARRIVVGVTGASGAPYTARVLGFLKDHAAGLGLEPHLVFTRFGRLVWGDEVGVDPESYGMPVYNPADMLAPFASGSAGFDAMVVVPCSVAALGRIASGVSSDLVSRAADVMLKERRKLVLVVRESPYNLIHLRNMVALTEAGALVMPASPSFYSAPSTMDELLDTVTARILDQLGVPNELMRRWTGQLQGTRP